MHVLCISSVDEARLPRFADIFGGIEHLMTTATVASCFNSREHGRVAEVCVAAAYAAEIRNYTASERSGCA